MKENVRDQPRMHLRRAAVAVLAIGAVAAGTVHADHSNTACAVAGSTMDAPPARDFGPIDTVLTYELNRLFDVKQVRVQRTRTDAGTTSVPTESGLCLTGHPAVEWTHQLKEISAN